MPPARREFDRLSISVAAAVSETMEREAEDDRLAGRATAYDSDEELLAALDARTKPLDADA